MTLDQFLQNLWDSYTQIAPSALKIRQLLETRGENWANDHIAFRTYDRSPINLSELERHLWAYGYRRYQPYRFEDKKIRAFGYIHPDRKRPRVFLSELETDKFSQETNEIIDSLVSQIDPANTEQVGVLNAGLLWDLPSQATYKALQEESEYAAWVAVNGLCANHFTVSVNELEGFDDIDSLMTFLEDAGIQMNLAGGRIKGTPEVKLVQGSTMADTKEVTTQSGESYEITTCYVEFAQRFDGFDGFVPKSADRIFESTNVQKPE